MYDKSNINNEERVKMDTAMAARMQDALSAGRDRLSWGQLARRMGVTTQTIRRWRAGESRPSIDDLQTFAYETGVRLEWLIEGTGPMLAQPESPVPPELAQAMAQLIDAIETDSGFRLYVYAIADALLALDPDNAQVYKEAKRRMLQPDAGKQ